MFGNASGSTTGLWLQSGQSHHGGGCQEKRAGLCRAKNQMPILSLQVASIGWASYRPIAVGQPLPPATRTSRPTLQECFVGELGLTGEVRCQPDWATDHEAAKLKPTQDLCSSTSDGQPANSWDLRTGVTTIMWSLKKVLARADLESGWQANGDGKIGYK